MQALLAVVLLATIGLLGCADPPPPEDGGPTPPDSGATVDTAGVPYLPGEQQPVADATRSSLLIYPTGEGQNLRQTFAATSDVELGYIELPVSCETDVLLNVKVRDDSNAILYEANVRELVRPADGSFNLIQLFDPAVSTGIPLESGRTYAFELAAFPGTAAASRTCSMSPGPGGDSYARGQGFYQDPINGPDFLPLPIGASGGNEDLPFITLVRARER